MAVHRYRLIHSEARDRYEVQKKNWLGRWKLVDYTWTEDTAITMWNEITEGPKIIREVILRDKPDGT